MDKQADPISHCIDELGWVRQARRDLEARERVLVETIKLAMLNDGLAQRSGHGYCATLSERKGPDKIDREKLLATYKRETLIKKGILTPGGIQEVLGVTPLVVESSR